MILVSKLKSTEKTPSAEEDHDIPERSGKKLVTEP